MKAVRFRCPKCQTQHSVVAARAGQALVCKTCFGPLIVPEAIESPASEAPTTVEAAQSRSIRVERPDPISMEWEPEPKTPPSKVTRPLSKVGRRSMIAVAVVLIAAVGVVVGLHRLRSTQGDGHLLEFDGHDDKNARTLLAAPIEPRPVPGLTPPTPAPSSAVEPMPPTEVPAAKPEAPAPRPDPDRPLVIRRRQMLDQDALRRQLAELPEITATDKTESALIALHQVALPITQRRSPGSTQGPQRRGAQGVQEERTKRRNPAAQGPNEAPSKPVMHVVRHEGAPREMLAMIQEKQPELAALPWRMGDECHLGREAAEDLQVVSRALRTLLSQVTPQGDTRPDAELLRTALLEEPSEEETTPGPQGVSQAQAATPRQRRTPPNKTRFVVPAAIPALQQLLMAERTPVRLVLVDVVDKIPGKEAVKALARLAMFDLAREVRERALLALRARLAEDYRPALLEGLRYPWAPVADHAAEALVALGDREAVSSLVDLLDQPDPLRPRAEVRDGKPVTLATSLVQVNHLQNCVLCHAPSGDATRDFVRGRVPDESQPLPPPVEYYANSSPGLFVRADVTYLRQDFSVTQPVEDSGVWPAYQRYDYLVTEKPTSRWTRDLTSRDQDEYPQRESVLFALRELTGRDLGPRTADWKAEARARPPAE